jgi:beta-N-acetylhexosaminidase
LINGELNKQIFSTTKKHGFDKQVADHLWINNHYEDSIYRQIITSGLGEKKYLYSDLGYYFIKKIIEKQTKSNLDDYLSHEIYKPLGLRTIGFQPLNRFPMDRICPTEDDKIFRKQLIHGYVHDPGAAMLGGIGGHAGLFSNATDLATLLEVVMQKGKYANTRYFSESVVHDFTKAQFSGNRRGIGFDRPNMSGGGTCHELASQKSYGHSGFTGTLVWSDPLYQMNYVFLSNRVYKSAENWKLRDMNVRTEIQRVIYEALSQRKTN